MFPYPQRCTDHKCQRELIFLMRQVTGKIRYNYEMKVTSLIKPNTAVLRGWLVCWLWKFSKATLLRVSDLFNKPIKAPSDNKWSLELAFTSEISKRYGFQTNTLEMYLL